MAGIEEFLKGLFSGPKETETSGFQANVPTGPKKKKKKKKMTFREVMQRQRNIRGPKLGTEQTQLRELEQLEK